MANNSRYILDAVPNFRSGMQGFQAGTPPQEPKFSSSIINSAVPGGSALTQSASSMVGNLLQGLPGTSVARRANAYFGGASGMPSSDFVRNRGFDLYNQQGDQRQQQGFQDLLALISGITSPTLQQRGQDIQSSQFNQNLGENQRQFDLGYGLQAAEFAKRYPKRGMIGTTEYSAGGGSPFRFTPTPWRDAQGWRES